MVELYDCKLGLSYKGYYPNEQRAVGSKKTEKSRVTGHMANLYEVNYSVHVRPSAV